MQYKRTLTNTGNCSANHSGDADPIRIQNGVVQQNKIAVQYNSNHA